MAPSPVVVAAVGVMVAAGIVNEVVGDQLVVGVARAIVIVADWVPCA